MSLVEKLFGSFSDRELKKINPIAKQVLALEEKYAAMPDADLQAQTAVFKQQLADGKTTDDILPDAFAVCREAAWRVLGMKHFPVQVIGGIALHRGDISEMQTGEGKTLVATLPAYHGRGFARAMMEACIDVARAAGKRAVRLDTFTTNVRAQSLYESCGFEDKGEWTVHYPALGDIQVAMYELAL